MKTNLFNNIEEYKAPECKTVEVLLESDYLLIPASGNVGDPGAAGAQGDWAVVTNNGEDF